MNSCFMKKINYASLKKKTQKVSKRKPHVRWNHERSDESQVFDDSTGVYYFVVVGERKERRRILSLLSEEFSKIGPINELVKESEGKVADSKYRFSLVVWESQAAPESVDWGCITIPKTRDRNLYSRKKENPKIEMRDYVEGFFLKGVR